MIRSLFFILFLCVSVLSADVKVTVSRKTVRQNESISVVFSSNQNLKMKPDFTPIARDFDILSQNQSSSTRMINGVIEHEVTWTLNLVSKREGDIVIPSIQFGNYRTEPVVIHVTEPVQATIGDPIYLEMEISPEHDVLALSQVLCTIRLYRSVNLYNGRISELRVSDPDAIIEQIGEDREYDQINGGVRYIVLERKAAIFPQHPGALTISPVVFEGQIVKSSRSVFNMQTQYVRLATKEKSLTVKAIPDGFTQNNWLPAEDIKLVDEWSSDIGKVVAGEPITRTLTVMADGCLASQIPQIAMNIPSDIKQYPDKPQLINQSGLAGNTGILQTKVALIATQPGTVVLPEVSLKWWDVKTDQAKTASLPSIELKVWENQAVTAPAPLVHESSNESVQQVPEHRIPWWAWVLIGLNGGWLVMLLRKKRVIPTRRHSEKPALLSQVKQKLKMACGKNDAKEAERWLLVWAESVFPTVKPLNLTTIKPYLTEDFREEVEDLNESLYGQNTYWSGKELWEAFESFKIEKNTKTKSSTAVLRGLYE